MEIHIPQNSGVFSRSLCADEKGFYRSYMYWSEKRKTVLWSDVQAKTEEGLDQKEAEQIAAFEAGTLRDHRI